MSPPAPLACSLLFALAAAAQLHGAWASPQTIGYGGDGDQCKTVVHGDQLGSRYPLQFVYIQPGVQDANVDIPYACPTGLYMLGEEVKACDDVKPDVSLPGWPLYTPATIHRNGNYWAGPCRVEVALWCGTANKQ